jgi:hypothetical protein
VRWWPPFIGDASLSDPYHTARTFGPCQKKLLYMIEAGQEKWGRAVSERRAAPTRRTAEKKPSGNAPEELGPSPLDPFCTAIVFWLVTVVMVPRHGG